MNILFITHNRLGDAVLSSCVLNHLQQIYPQAKFTIAAGEVPAEIFEDMPKLFRLIIFKKQKYHLHWLKLWAKCIFTRWFMVVDLRGSALCYELWTQKRFYHYPRHTEHLHRVERYNQLIKTKSLVAPKIWIGKKHQSRASDLVQNRNSIIAIAPAANWHAKTWPIENFIELIHQLNTDILVIAAPHEREKIQPLLNAIPKKRLLDLAGTEHLLTVAACLKHCDFFIGNDSGIMHLAAAVGIPTLGLFGPTDPIKYKPFGEHGDIICDSERVMKNITVQQVLSRIKKSTVRT